MNKFELIGLFLCVGSVVGVFLASSWAGWWQLTRNVKSRWTRIPLCVLGTAFCLYMAAFLCYEFSKPIH